MIEANEHIDRMPFTSRLRANSELRQTLDFWPMGVAQALTFFGSVLRTSAFPKNACLTTLFIFTTALPVQGAEISGNWRFDKAVDYSDSKAEPKPMKFNTVQVVGTRAGLGQDCLADLRKEPFSFSAVFRPFVDAGQSKKDLAEYLKKQFQFDLDNNAGFYTVVQRESCHDRFRWVLTSGDKLLVPFAGHTFYGFSRVTQDGKSLNDPILGMVAITGLPFNLNNYYELCSKKITGTDGKAHDTSACEPLYSPTIARKTAPARLSQLIGTHNFERNNAEYTDDYAPPFAKDMHPTYITFPPKKDVLLVRVDDFEPGPKSERNTFGGAYLSIKAGKVVDQLNSGCNIDEQYRCVDYDGTKLYQLQDNGKFQKLK